MRAKAKQQAHNYGVSFLVNMLVNRPVNRPVKLPVKSLHSNDFKRALLTRKALKRLTFSTGPNCEKSDRTLSSGASQGTRPKKTCVGA